MADDTAPGAPTNEITRTWLREIESAQTWHSKWHEQGKKVSNRYLDEKREAASSNPAHRMNVLWSNTETVKPALYAKTPTAKVVRRYRDKDPVGRWGGIVLERALNYSLDSYDTDYHLRNAISDYLLPGRGQVWLYYKPKIVETGKDDKGEPVEKLEWESCEAEHVHWKDYLTSPARTENEVWWKAKRAFLDKDAVKKRFGQPIADKLSFTEQSDTDKEAEANKDQERKALIWEIWNKRDGKVYFISKGHDGPLEPPKPPKIKYDGFFPCPRPIVTTTTTDSILPVPDYVQYQDQAIEIDRLTQRINLLTKALRVTGMYDSTIDGLSSLLSESSENKMVPCDNWAMFAQAGGIEGTTAFFPLKDIIAALRECYTSREAAKQAMYEVTGISDIVRGASDPNETLGAQQIKTQWGGLRIRDRQKEVQRFVRDILRLMAEIYAEQFSQETLQVMTNVPLKTEQEKQDIQRRKQASDQAKQVMAQYQQMAQQAQSQGVPPPPPPSQPPVQEPTADELKALKEPSWEQVMTLLRDEKLRGFRIDIETDSTINADEQSEKQSRTEFVTAMTTLFQGSLPMVQQYPQLGKVVGEVALFAVRGFKAGETLEGTLEEVIDAFDAGDMQGAQNQPPAEDPKLVVERERLALDKDRLEDDKAFRREKMDKDANTQVQIAQMKAQEAANAKPAVSMQLTGEEMLGQVAQAIMGSTQQQGAALQQLIEQNAQANQANQSLLMQGIDALKQAATAPKQISVQRDASGRVVGGTATPSTVQ